MITSTQTPSDHGEHPRHPWVHGPTMITSTQTPSEHGKHPWVHGPTMITSSQTQSDHGERPRSSMVSWGMGPPKLSQPCSGQGLDEVVNPWPANHVPNSDLLIKCSYLPTSMNPEFKPQRMCNQISYSFGCWNLFTSQRSIAHKCCACHVILLSRPLHPLTGAREQPFCSFLSR